MELWNSKIIFKMFVWDQVYGELKLVESSINDNIQLLNNLIRDIGDDSAGPDQLAMLKDLETTVESSLRKYSKLLRDMEVFVNGGGTTSQRSIFYRFSEVFKELQSSYNTSKAKALRKTTRVELFSRQFSEKHPDDSETQLLLKEMTAAKNSLRMADDYLESASLSHENLRNQRNRLQNSSGLIGAITNRFPQINNLANSISNQKNRDNLIIGLFIAICICFCIWYANR